MLDTRAVLVTRGGRGMLLRERDRDPSWIPAVAREVYDVTGAGDTVVAVMALSLSAGADLPDAALLANLAGGIAVSWGERSLEEEVRDLHQRGPVIMGSSDDVTLFIEKYH